MLRVPLSARLAYRLESGPGGDVLHPQGQVTRPGVRELAELLAELQLAADTTFAMVATIVHPRRMRWDAL
jgi:hypothetical protein